MSDRLTKRKDYGSACWNGDQNLVTHRRYMRMLDALAEYEDAIFDADGNEIISLDRLRELATADAEGRVVVMNEVFETPRGYFGFIYYDKNGLFMGSFYPTEAEAARALSEASAGEGE